VGRVPLPHLGRAERTCANRVYGPATPVARLKSGDTLDTNTLDCFGNALKAPGDTLSMAKGDNPLTGPFYVEGAQPGDTLAIKILALEVDGDSGIGAFAPGFGALNETHYTPMLHPPLPEKIWFYPINRADHTAWFKALDSDFKVKIPLHPFFGCMGVAPANGEARSSIVPGEFGGNMDAPEASVGNTLYLPVNVAGGLLYIGDGHAAMGDGEVAGTAIKFHSTHVCRSISSRGRVSTGRALRMITKSWRSARIVRWMTAYESHLRNW
jgi:amidase